MKLTPVTEDVFPSCRAALVDDRPYLRACECRTRLTDVTRSC